MRIYYANKYYCHGPFIGVYLYKKKQKKVTHIKVAEGYFAQGSID